MVNRGGEVARACVRRVFGGLTQCNRKEILSRRDLQGLAPACSALNLSTKSASCKLKQGRNNPVALFSIFPSASISPSSLASLSLCLSFCLSLSPPPTALILHANRTESPSTIGTPCEAPQKGWRIAVSARSPSRPGGVGERNNDKTPLPIYHHDTHIQDRSIYRLP